MNKATLGPQKELLEEERELVRMTGPTLGDFKIMRRARDFTADEIMAMSEEQYSQLLWAIGGYRLKNILLAAGKSRTTPPCPLRKKE
jgi:hypothetical protein